MGIDPTEPQLSRRACLAAGALALPAAALAFPAQDVAPSGGDDTAALQAAIDAAAKTGGAVRLTGGNYQVQGSLRVRSAERFSLLGEGNATTILMEKDEPLIVWDAAIACNHARVADLRVRSVGEAKSPSTPVFALDGGVTRSTFENLDLDGSEVALGSGFRTRKVADTCSFLNCVLWNIAGTGYEVAMGSEVRIIGGRVIGDPARRDRGVGIHLTGNNGGVHVVTTDIIALQTGLLLGSPGGPSNREVFLTHSTFDSSQYGIRQLDASYVSVAGMWAASSDQAQIVVEESARGTLSMVGGTVFNGGAYGAPGAADGLVMRSGTLLASGVTFRYNKGRGLALGPATVGATLSACRFESNGRAAILEGRGHQMTGCVLTGAGLGIEDRRKGARTRLGVVAL